jgi:hypothetical protein
MSEQIADRVLSIDEKCFLVPVQIGKRRRRLLTILEPLFASTSDVVNYAEFDSISSFREEG